jgi:DNA mismatch repair ATPase MutS
LIQEESTGNKEFVKRNLKKSFTKGTLISKRNFTAESKNNVSALATPLHSKNTLSVDF